MMGAKLRLCGLFKLPLGLVVQRRVQMDAVVERFDILKSAPTGRLHVFVVLIEHHVATFG